MSEIRFYHLQSQPLEQALPALLSKAYENGHKILVKAPTDKIEALNEALWTFRADSFLPHGSAKDGHEQDQPILITDNDDNPNGADVLILTHNLESPNAAEFKLCCEVFDGRIDEHVQAARSRWSAYKEQGLTLTYWQQTAQGGWDKKA
jgi:DNA polymerase-3 subunit chi